MKLRISHLEAPHIELVFSNICILKYRVCVCVCVCVRARVCACAHARINFVELYQTRSPSLQSRNDFLLK